MIIITIVNLGCYATNVNVIFCTWLKVARQQVSALICWLLGNKCDQKDRIAVTTAMAQKFAEFHEMILFETSAKDEGESNQVNNTSSKNYIGLAGAGWQLSDFV